MTAPVLWPLLLGFDIGALATLAFALWGDHVIEWRSQRGSTPETERAVDVALEIIYAPRAAQLYGTDVESSE